MAEPGSANLDALLMQDARESVPVAGFDIGVRPAVGWLVRTDDFTSRLLQLATASNVHALGGTSPQRRWR